MQAIRVHAFGDLESVDLRVDEIPDPTPGEDEVLVEVHAIGINPVDTYVASGTYATKPELPYVPGADAAGVVAAVGPGVVAYSEGDRVFVAGSSGPNLQGCYAETVVSPMQRVRPLTDHLSFEQGAALNVAYVTAFRALIDVAHVRPGETVLVHGATGGVGLAAVQIALGHKLKVWATGGSDEGRKMLVEQGVPRDHVLDHHAADHLDALPDDGVNVIIELSADVNLAIDLPKLSKNGRVVVVGNRGDATINARYLMGTQSSIVGMNYWSGGDAAISRALDAIVSGCEAGDLRPIIQASLPMTQCREAWQLVMKSGSGGKIVLVP